MVVIDVAPIEEGGDAVFQCHKGGADGEKFMPRDNPVVWVALENN